jgi:hypothetical protein
VLRSKQLHYRPAREPFSFLFLFASCGNPYKGLCR